MKSIFKNKILAIIMAVVIGITGIVSGLVISANASYASTLPEMSDLTFSTDVGNKPVLKGGSFILYLTYSSKYSDTYWAAMDMCIGPLTADKTEFDKAVAKKLTVDRTKIDYGELFMDDLGYKSSGTGDFLSKETTTRQQGGCFRLVITSNHVGGDSEYPSNQTITIGIPFTVAADIDVEELTFGIVKTGDNPTTTNGVSFGAQTTPKNGPVESRAIQGIITTNEVTVKLLKEEDDTFLKTLSMGPDATNLTNIDLDNEPYGYTISQAMDNLVVKPETEVDSATAQVGISDGSTGYKPSGALAADGTITFPRPNHNDKVVVLVTSQSGKEALYEVTITISYVRLEALTVTAGDGTTTGSTSLGLQETFDKDTFTYTVNVPEDETSGATAKVTPTVISGYDASTTIGLAGTNCTVDASVTSATEFTVSGIKKDAPATVTMTTTAADGTTTQDYVLTFATLNTDTSMTIQAVAATKTYDSDSTKATEKSVDYYFYLDQETVFEASFLITVANGATVTITDEASTTTTYDDTTKNNKYPVGTYTVKVTAQAGNSQDYTVIIAAPEVLELTLDSTYLFLFEEDDSGFIFRDAYIEFDMVHGVDDKDWTCHIVLGNIPYYTTIKTFLSNIKESLHPLIRIYDNYNELLYNRGNPAEGYTEADMDDVFFSVGTGWRIELGAGDTPVDVVYTSVLGDMDSDGQATGNDISLVSSYLMGKEDFDASEYRLAAEVSNGGSISGSDVSQISSILNGRSEPETFSTYVEHGRADERYTVVVYMG